MSINKKASCSLMIGNLISTILVIAIHYNSKSSIIISGGYDWNYLFQEFFINGISRIAVPFFAMISGFFIVNKLNLINGYTKTLKSKFISLVVPYIAASTVIFAINILMKVVFRPGLYQPVSVSSLVFDVLFHPVSGQYWFLRDLIILIILSPIMFSISKVLVILLFLP
jgi:surface polysaccharide O-acyltransferase-like enzyme